MMRLYVPKVVITKKYLPDINQKVKNIFRVFINSCITLLKANITIGFKFHIHIKIAIGIINCV